MIVVDKVLEELVTQGVNALVQNVTDNVKLIRGINSEIIDLTSDIETFNARLGEAFKNPRANDHNVLRVIVKKFRFVVDEAKDTIANYVVLNKRHGDNVFSKSLDRIPLCGKVNAYASDIKSIRAKMKAIRQEHERELLYLMKFEIRGQDNDVKTLQARPIAKKNEVLGFEEDLKKVRIRLSHASNNLVVIPIVGMPGTGKTTFASMLFEDSSIHRNSIRIWVHISKRCDIKQKFISIIYQITKIAEDLTNKTEEMLRDTIRNLLKDQVYFIILDDVWAKTDWNSLKAAFPENKNGSKILVTTRHANVVDSTWKSHHLDKLSIDDGWKLIKNNVFGTEGCSDELFEGLGIQIANKCDGLPLALVVVAGILRKCTTSTDWQRVADNPLLEINREDQSYHGVVKLSYDDLPHEKLKNCFLYFAYFPMGHEIAVWKLVRLWIAEEFIPTVNEWGYPLDDVEVEAQKYLNDLVDRNLVVVERRRADGQIKTCRILDIVHEFCKSEAARKELFHIMVEEQRLDDENTCSSSTRRLGFHSFTADIFDDSAENKSFAGLFPNCYSQSRSSLYRFGKHIHSLLLSSTQKSETRFAQEKLATIPNSFPLLRVLNIESIHCDLLPNEVYGLYLLKYLAITSNLNLLPESFKNLRELETIVIKTTSRTLQIEGGIWNMEKLRHVRTNTSAQLPFPPKTNYSGGKAIRTLSTISPTSCTKEIFSRTPNLQKLGVRGNLFQLLEEKKNNICLLNNLGMLKCLENLKLYGQYDNMLTVPILDKFACKLKKLSFSGTLFKWKDITVLGLLEELEVLKLDDYAFKGENWELSNNVVFRRLQYLRIGRTNLVTWKLATHNSFPALRVLVLRNCSSLERIPESFSRVHTLKVMELFHMSKNAVKSANDIKENVVGNDTGIKLIVITFEKRERPTTAAMDMVIEQDVSEAVDRLVQTVAAYNNNVKQSRGPPPVVDSAIQDLTSEIETFNARLVEAYKNPIASVNVLIVKNFQTVVNKAEDAAANYIALRKKMYEHDSLRPFPLPSNIVKVNSCENEIKSVKEQVKTIRQEHENYLQSLNQYKTGVLLSLQRDEVTVFDKVIEDIKVVVNKLVQIVDKNVKMQSVLAEINDMTSHIQAFEKKLVEACKNPNANEHRVLRVAVKKFRMLVNEAEEALANYFALVKKYRGKHLLQKQLDCVYIGKVIFYEDKIKSISSKMETIGKDHDKDLLYLLDYKHIDLPLPKTGPVIHENKRLKTDLETIKGSVMEASNNLIVIAIVGVGGTGKTTFASTLFKDPQIIQKFTHCIWVHVSQYFDRKQSFISILYQITKHKEDFSMVPEDVVAHKIWNLLKGKRYFIVLDDVWDKKVWDYFKVVFPEDLNGSRVLVTTRSDYLVDSTWKSHKLELLSDDDGWLIIEKIVFGEMGCGDPSFAEIGRRIAKLCKGLPLALVMVAGVLRKCTTIVDWQRMAENLLSGIPQERQSFHELIKLGYKYLPHEMLKNCFLYFAYFPQGHDIAVWKLIRLWIAEEFIPIIDEFGYPLDVEVEAQKYLNDLVDRNLVIVRKRRADGQIKICYIHNVIHDFCRSEATRKNLFKVMDYEERKLDDDENTSSSSTFHENTSSIRRLCFHSFTENKFDVLIKSYEQKRSLCPLFGKHIHSLLLFSSQKGEAHYREENLLETIANTFPLLRVLNIEISNKLKLKRNGRCNLHLLRYLAIKGNLDSLPKSFKNLRGLETLVIETTARELQIDEGIWNLKKLRHVHTNISMKLPFPPKRSTIESGGKNIRTLSTILPRSCTRGIFWKTPNLQKLCVRGDLSEFLNESESVIFKMLKCLENLKLYGMCDKVLTLPMRVNQAPRLKKLTFSGTVFDWKDMFVLGLLEELEVLKLDDYAFKGEVCDLRYKNIVFKRLQYLRIGRTNLVTWKVSQNSFPALQSLVLRNCSSLKSIPEAFANVHTLEVMELVDMSESAVQSAKEVKEKLRNSGFQLQLHITSKMGEGPMTAGTDTMIEAVKEMVKYVERSSGRPPGLYSELKNVSLDIEMLNARLQEAAYRNPIEPVNVFIMKNFQTIVNEAKDVAHKYWLLTIEYKVKTLTKFSARMRRNVKSCESKIQSVKSMVKILCQQYENDLHSLAMINRNNVLLTPQIERPIDFDKVIAEVEQAVKMLVQTVGDNVNQVSDIIVKSEIEDITSLIKTFTENLVVACKNPQANEDCVLRVIIKKFRTLSNEARDAVTNYFAQEKKHGENPLAKAFDKIRPCGKLNNVASKIQSIKEKVKTISEDHKEDLRHLREDYNEHTHLPPLKVRSELRENKILGFNDDLKTIKTQLMDASKDFFVIPIVGNAGTGKTTFASKIFEDPEIRNYFTHFVWIHVS
ncbi:PREDICTED: uncharacterized protein LOC109181763 [Ipomoea nil]|uniref:uncharacterized protein LOC109181763 n=1 Tax=Ipomoea nil TaxID=35883 RepID=UPI0009008FF7|nr:PREDICTED: uncharacterized protein LOC109181763 [Ipomoea nil]